MTTAMDFKAFGSLVLAFLLICVVHAETDATKSHAQGTDCSDIKVRSAQNTSGVVIIQPAGVSSPFQVFCEMESDGGWTVFQRRSGKEVSFHGQWAAYKDGFGSLEDDHWLGLEKLYLLTNQSDKQWLLRVDLWDHEGGTAHAVYDNFTLGDETSAYRLQVGQYSGNAGDAIRGAYPGIDQNGFGFSTTDRDNDGCSPCIFGDIAENECTFSKRGGWWYSRCGSAELHGDWHEQGDHIGWASGLHWKTWKSPAPYSLKATRMMVKAV